MAKRSNQNSAALNAYTRCAMALGLMLAMLLQTARPLWGETPVSQQVQYSSLHAPHWQATAADGAGWASLEEWEEEWEEDWGNNFQQPQEDLSSVAQANRIGLNPKRANLALQSLSRPLYALYCRRNIHLLSIA